MQDLPAYTPRRTHTAAAASAFPPNYSAISLPATSNRHSRSVRPTSARSASSHRASLIRPTFAVGSKRTPAVVTPADLKAHLVLLRAFHALQDDVNYRARKSDMQPNLTADTAWRWFLTRAVWRFELWLKNVVTPESAANRQGPDRKWFSLKEIPPLDVLMVWHTYLLHPRVYFEDGLRYNTGLLARGSFPLHEVVAMLENDDSHVPGSGGQERAYHWESSTGQPWEPATSLVGASESRQIECPSCLTPLEVKWIDQDDTGWAQDGFATRCGSCRLPFTKEAMGVAKFSDDLRKIVEEPKRHTLATIHLSEYTGKPALSVAKFFNENLTRNLKKATFYPSPRAFAERDLEWKLAEVEKRCTIGFQMAASSGSKDPKPEGLQRILRAYSVPGPFSIDLVSAMSRHMGFVQKMVDLKWTDLGRFDNENDESLMPLKRAIAQYHAFLNVMACNPTEFLVPTLSIDLAWHTHQLLCVEYCESTLALLGTIVDHDDGVEQECLAAAFEHTARLWTSRYNVPYTICGCPIPSNTTKSKPITAAASKFFGKKGKAKATPPSTPTSVSNPRPDLLSHRGTDVYETHPSDHARVKVVNNSTVTVLALSREKATNKRLAEEQEALANGAADEWQCLVHDVRQKQVVDGGGAFPHVPAFETSSLSPSDTIDVKSMSAGQCAMGIGAAGMCAGGNRKARMMAFTRDDSHTMWSNLWAGTENLRL